jgi:hypothetical protein
MQITNIDRHILLNTPTVTDINCCAADAAIWIKSAKHVCAEGQAVRVRAAAFSAKATDQSSDACSEHRVTGTVREKLQQKVSEP